MEERADASVQVNKRRRSQSVFFLAAPLLIRSTRLVGRLRDHGSIEGILFPPSKKLKRSCVVGRLLCLRLGGRESESSVKITVLAYLGVRLSVTFDVRKGRASSLPSPFFTHRL